MINAPKDLNTTEISIFSNKNIYCNIFCALKVKMQLYERSAMHFVMISIFWAKN